MDYYRDYGETLEATFFHDLTINYEYEEVICDHTTCLDSEVNLNSVLLRWSNSADNIRGYHVYRNNTRITSELLTDTTYIDENLPNGNYNYYVRTYYIMGCVSDSSNHVEEKIELGIKEFGNNITVYPNPTTGELTIENGEWRIENVEVFDVYGRKLVEQKAESRKQNVINISELHAGIFFIKITTEKGIITKKIIKN